LKTTVQSLYETLLENGIIDEDPAQLKVVAILDALLKQLEDAGPSAEPGGIRLWPFKKAPPAQTPTVRGVYIWGPVGRGKTLLMDLFYDALSLPRKKRCHFQEFMADIHERAFRWRQQSLTGTTRFAEPVTPIVEDLAREVSVLCFDEFSVTDIADAMILGRLFSGLFQKGVVVVATSNVEPSKLYENGLNRNSFLPFIAELEQRLKVVPLMTPSDYRLQKIGAAPVFYTPADDYAKEAMDHLFYELTGHRHGTRAVFNIKGHRFEIPEAIGGVARCSFSDLCERALGASDYMALARAYHTLFIDGVPKMDIEMRNEAKRFTLLVDALYNARVKLVLSAETNVQELYYAATGPEIFEFDRTVSRLIEMRSRDYLNADYSPAAVA
jgi:cell division protein ZapE